MTTLAVTSSRREEMLDITRAVHDVVMSSGVSDGLAVCFVPHTTAGITINENADPDVTRDILHKLGKGFPRQDGYLHSEGNSDAHVKASLIGSSVTVIIEGGHLRLGTWQGIYFCEFDGPRRRTVYVQISGG